MLITGTGPYKGPAGFDRGMQTTMYCGKDPESWVRGSATLDTGTGQLVITIDLETDSTLAGPKGKVVITIKAADGKALATVTSDELGITGKKPGTFRLEKFGAVAQIDPEVCKQASSLTIEALCTGKLDGIWGIPFGALVDAFKTVIAVL